jgi:hypothetical protein
MSAESVREERNRLARLLDAYESGRVTHYDEDSRGELNRDVTPERIAEVRAKLERLNELLAEGGS